MSQQLGFAAEEEARAYLLAQGLQWLCSNYYCRWGEIDLIMREGPSLVFVEVRARSNAGYGAAMATVTRTKQKKLLKAASHYLLSRKISDKYPLRFDVLSLEGRPARIEWVKNAFGTDF